jgi:hypothetical protein
MSHAYGACHSASPLYQVRYGLVLPHIVTARRARAFRSIDNVRVGSPDLLGHPGRHGRNSMSIRPLLEETQSSPVRRLAREKTRARNTMADMRIHVFHYRWALSPPLVIVLRCRQSKEHFLRTACERGLCCTTRRLVNFHQHQTPPTTTR